MDPNSEVVFDSTHFRLYKNGSIDRLHRTVPAPPGIDEATGVTSKDVVIDADTGLSVRLFIPGRDSNTKKLPVVVYFHGGAFIVESAVSTTYHGHVSSLAAKGGFLAVSVDYRLAPEHPVPAAYEDSWAALQWAVSGRDEWLAEHGDMQRVFLAGDSAGGNIVHNLAVMATGQGIKIEGAILLHPWFGGKEAIEGEEAVTREITEKLWGFVCPTAVGGTDDQKFNPTSANAPGLEGLGCERVLVCVGEKDGLSARAREYYKALTTSGWRGSASWLESKGEGHVFFLQAPESDNAKELMDRVVAFVAGA